MKSSEIVIKKTNLFSHFKKSIKKSTGWFHLGVIWGLSKLWLEILHLFHQVTHQAGSNYDYNRASGNNKPQVTSIASNRIRLCALLLFKAHVGSLILFAPRVITYLKLVSDHRVQNGIGTIGRHVNVVFLV